MNTESILTSKKMDKVFMDCFFREEEDASNAVMVEGVTHDFGFHPERLESHKEEIKQMLLELPDAFRATSGGGWSFLNACMTKDGVQWGEHIDIEKLLVLGIATKQAKILMPRDMWSILPGGMPYFQTSV